MFGWHRWIFTKLITPLPHTTNHIFLFYGRALTIIIHAYQMAMPKLPYFLRRFCGHHLPIYVGRDICLLFTWMIHIFKVTLSTTCQRNVYATVNLLQDLGFNVNDKISVFTPTQKLEFLGFILDSLLMTITLTARRKVALLDACSKLLQKSRQKIRVVSTVIVVIIAALPGVKHGAPHYRTLESEKTAALRHNGDWWHTNVSTSHHFIRAPPPVEL